MPTVPDNGPYPWEGKPDLSRRETQYLVFVDISHAFRGMRTRVWQIQSRSSGDLLGRIKWYGRWRQYTFKPEPDTVWNSGCITDINTFIGDAMKDWRESRVPARRS